MSVDAADVDDHARYDTIAGEQSHGLTILNWNIRHGGGRRRDRIATAVAESGADVAVLTEYRPAPELLERLASSGYEFTTKQRATRRRERTALPSSPVSQWPRSRAASLFQIAYRPLDRGGIARLVHPPHRHLPSGFD
jgi:hypothetical protein